MRKMNNYYFVSTVKPSNKQEYYTYVVSRAMIENPKLPFYNVPEGKPFVSLIGRVNERDVSTSCIFEFEEEFVRTASGSRYELGRMNKDYRALCRAYEKDIPILVDFIIVKENGKTVVKGYLLSKEGVSYIERIVYFQDLPKNLLILEDDSQLFVNWATIDKREESYLLELAKKGGLHKIEADAAWVYETEKELFKEEPNVILGQDFLKGFPKFYIKTEWPSEEQLKGEKEETIFQKHYEKNK